MLASSAYGSLWSVRLDDQLSLATRRRLYSACVLTVLLYGAECWAPLWTDLRHLDDFYHQCLCDMLVLSWEQRKSDWITSARLGLMWGDTVSILDCVRRLFAIVNWSGLAILPGWKMLACPSVFYNCHCRTLIQAVGPAFRERTLCHAILVLVVAVIDSAFQETAIASDGKSYGVLRMLSLASSLSCVLFVPDHFADLLI